jgi:hypothetical protein
MLLRPFARAGLLLIPFLALLAQYGERRNQAYEREMQNPSYEDPPDAWVEGEFAFARLRYRSYGGGGRYRRSSWGTDSNKAERHFLQGVRRLSRVDTRSVEEIIDADSDEIFKWPWLYAVEVGHWELSEPQAHRLRDYLTRGGSLMVDDFHGTREWEVFMASLQRVFPDRPVVDIPDADSIFHTIYDLDKKIQVAGLAALYRGVSYEYDGYQPHWRGVYDDKGRVMVMICWNQDNGDAWEWADSPEYPEAMTSQAYRMGINNIIYSMTH